MHADRIIATSLLLGACRAGDIGATSKSPAEQDQPSRPGVGSLDLVPMPVETSDTGDGGDTGGGGGEVEGEWLTVSASGGINTNFCAIRLDGSIRCWGGEDDGLSTPPDGSFKFVECEWFNCCAIDDAGMPSCWGEWDNLQHDQPVDYISIDWNGTILGTHPDGSVGYWGWTPEAVMNQPIRPVTEAVMDGWDACGIDADRKLACWATDPNHPEGGLTLTDAPTEQTIQRIDSAGSSSCVVSSDHQVYCWGYSGYIRNVPDSLREELVVDVDLGRDTACALLEDGRFTCWWGLDSSHHVFDSPEDIRFRELSAGQFGGVCGITTTNRLWCGSSSSGYYPAEEDEGVAP